MSLIKGVDLIETQEIVAGAQHRIKLILSNIAALK